MSSSPSKAIAAVFCGPDQPLEIREIELPQLAAGEGLVKIECCTLCGSDLHSISGKRSVKAPIILGHEIVGRLIEGTGLVDVEGATVEVGDRITWSVAASCDQCFFCQKNLPQKCERLFKYGHHSLNQSHPLSGGLATHCHFAKGTKIVRIPDSLSDFVASPANCATATVAGAIRVAGGCEGQNVLIIGAGMLGLTAAAMAKHNGAASVVVNDLNPVRAEMASRFGATSVEVSHPSEHFDGRGFDIVLEMSGSPSAIESSILQLRIGGRMILVGSVFPDRPVKLPAEQMVRRMTRIEGLHNYTPVDLSSAVSFLEQTHQQFPFDQLVEAEFALTDINNAVKDAQLHQRIRVAIVP